MLQTRTGSTIEATGTVIRDDDTVRGKQGLDYATGISARSTGACAIGMHMVTIPPKARAKARLHGGHETAIDCISGRAAMWYGERLEQYMVVQASDYLYIPAGMPHLPADPSETEPCVAVLARTDPNGQESVVLLPELDRVVAQ
jgi:uncharacterized RmlC-like cupin family protein